MLLSTEHAQDHSNLVAMEAVEKAKAQLKAQLEKQIQENIQLVKYVGVLEDLSSPSLLSPPLPRDHTELENHALEVEQKLSRLQEQSVDHQNLLTTMAQDKESLSR